MEGAKNGIIFDGNRTFPQEVKAIFTPLVLDSLEFNSTGRAEILGHLSMAGRNDLNFQLIPNPDEVYIILHWMKMVA